MTSSSVLSTPAPRGSRGSLFRGLAIFASLFVLCSALLAQNDPNAQGGRRRGQNNGGADNNNGGRGNFDPQQMQQQMLERLRDTFGVTDDAEWKLISDRINPVLELRRNTGGGLGGFRGGGPGGGRGGDTSNNNNGGGRRGFGGGSPESDALRAAVTDNLPEAEIKSRLERLRDARKANEEKLARAQEQLRAVLSVRQEAIAVMYGLLP